MTNAPSILPAPGIYRGIPEREYRAWPMLSQSLMKAGRASMAHMKAAVDAGPSVPTDAMQLGTALHTAFLEPELMPTRVVRWEGGTRKGQRWDEFCDEHADKVILTPAAHEQVIGMVRSLRKHPVIRRWQAKIEDVEVSGVGSICGVPVKGRCDAMTPDPLIDLKKVRSGDARTFTSAVLGFGYHWQAYVYRKIFNRDRFVLATVEDKPPFDVVAYELSPAFLREGEREVVAVIDQWKFACDRGVFPGRSDEIVQLEIPEWAASGDLVTFGDEE